MAADAAELRSHRVTRLTILDFGAFDVRPDASGPILRRIGIPGFLLETDRGARILFDTGNDPAIFEHNVKAKGADLTRLDFVVLSHRHSDHMGGLSYLLSVNPNVKIYAPKENFGIFGSSLPSSFYRKAEGLPGELRYFGGAPPQIMKFGTAWPTANFELIETTTEIAPGFSLIALVSDKPGTLEKQRL